MACAYDESSGDMTDDLHELDDLEQKLLFLKNEEAHLCEELCFGSKDIPLKSSIETMVLKSTVPSLPSYSAVDPLKGDVRGYKRARMIRRIGAIAALGLAVVAAVTIASNGDLDSSNAAHLESTTLEQSIDFAAAVVPEVLESASSSLTDGQKVLFENRYEHLLDSERRHKEWDEQRAAHLVRQITAASQQDNEVS